MIGKDILASFKEQNIILYYNLLKKRIEEMLTIVYILTDSEAIRKYYSPFQRLDRCYLNVEKKTNPDIKNRLL